MDKKDEIDISKIKFGGPLIDPFVPLYIDSKDGKGGFMLHDTEDGRKIANELLKDTKYVIRQGEEYGKTERIKE